MDNLKPYNHKNHSNLKTYVYHVNESFKSFQYVNGNEISFSLMMTTKLGRNSILRVDVVIFQMLVFGKL